ncbi:MFS transporter [Streptococcus sp. P25B114]|uniref:MFS transporter n=1 Tax=unclassified Streptococcus TaxID=2608887 RepID=UPI00374D5705
MKNREKNNINYLVASRSISLVGDVLFDFANNTFLANIAPNSLSLVAMYQAIERVIAVIFNMFGGVFADLSHRKKIIISTNLINGLFCIALSFVGSENILMYLVLVGNGILSLMFAFSSPSYKALTKEIVSEQSISKLNSYLETASTSIRLVLPIFSLLLYNLLKLQGVLLLNGITFIISSILIFCIEPLNFERAAVSFSVKSIFCDMASGFRYIFDNKQILFLIILSSLVNFFLAGYNLLLPYTHRMFINLSDGLYGLFLTAEAIGGLLGAILSSRLKKDASIFSLVVKLGVSSIFLIATPFLYLIYKNQFFIMLGPGLFNLFLTVFNIQFFSLIQKQVSNQYLGRVFGVIFTVAVLFMPIGTGIFSSLLDVDNLFNFLIIGMSILILSLVFGISIKYSER